MEAITPDDDIPFLKLRELQWASTVVLLGKRRAGKTFAMKQIIRHYNADLNLIFTGSRGSYKEFIKIVSPMHVFLGFDEEVLIAVAKMMDRPDLPRPRRVLILLDDLGSKEDVMRSELIGEVFSNARNWAEFEDQDECEGITVLLSIQAPKMITPTVRGNTDYLFCYKLASTEALRTVFKEYSCLKKFEEFHKTITELQDEKDYAALVLDNYSNRRRSKPLKWFVSKPDTGTGYTGSDIVNGFCAKMYEPALYRPALFSFGSKKGAKKAKGKVGASRKKFLDSEDGD